MHNCGSTGHCHHQPNDEFDPCLAKEIANIERDRVFYEKLKVQSDKFLAGLNIRLDHKRGRAAVCQEDEESCCSAGEETSPSAISSHVTRIAPSEWNKVVSANPGKKAILVAVPCDFVTGSQSVASISDSLLRDVLAAKPLRSDGSKDLPIFVQLRSPVCVCGKCEDPDTRITGSLKSITLLLRSDPSVIVTKSGGLLGLWTRKDGDLSAFISRYV
jgi:hypothetical protein